MEQVAARSVYYRRISLTPSMVGLIALLALLVLYLGLVSLISGSWSHALGLLAEDRWFVLPITLGFGMQAGLFTYLRSLHRTTRTPAAVTGSSAGTSMVAMVACCAHHVTDVLPLIGLSGATVLLAQYKVLFMTIGLLSNVAGIGVLVTTIRKAKMHIISEGGCH